MHLTGTKSSPYILLLLKTQTRLFIYLFIYLYTLFNEGKTHLANIKKLFYHVALSNTCNIYT